MQFTTAHRLARTTQGALALSLALGLSLTATAAENRAQRYTAGLGGSDMTTLLVPGWYGQVAMIHYHATKLKNNQGDDATVAGNINQSTLGARFAGTPLAGAQALYPNGVNYAGQITNFRADAYVMLPRITYISGSKFLGAHLGFTAMLPIIERQTSVSAATSLVGATGPVLNAANTLTAGVNAQIASRSSGAMRGLGDLEMAPVLNWEIGDHQTVTLTPTVVFPTGDYDKNRAVNAGFGQFYTFRPSLQYGFIGDGWDVAARSVFSFNTRNTETEYRSGTMFNLDFALMRFVSDNVRLGLQGYVVQQLTDDSSNVASEQALIDAEGGRKMRVYAVGPALAWLKDGGDMMVEGKILREFSARNRAEGTTFLLMVSKPFGM